MNQIFPDEGLRTLLEALTSINMEFKLFTNNITPNRSTNLAAMVEAAWAGYAPVVVGPADWTIFSLSSHIGTLMAAPIAFDNLSGGGVTCFGYYATDSLVTKLLLAARFDGAPLTINDGDSQSVIPIIGDFSKFAS